MEIKKGQIGNALESVAPDHTVAVAADIFDETLNKYQSELNQMIGQGGSGTVKGAKVGSGSTISPDSNGIVTLPNYETDAQKHKAPTAAEVKAALGTGTANGTFLAKDGNWATPPNTTYQSKTAASGGTDVSLVTTGEKYNWNGKADLTTMNARLDAQDAEIALLNGNDVIPVQDHTAVSNPDTSKIYREQGSDSYTDWMYYGGQWKKIATYSFPGIDSKPTYKSQNLVSSNGVYGVLENSQKNTSYLSENTTLSYTENSGFYYDDGPHSGYSGFYYRIYQVEPNRLYTFSSHFGGDTDIPFVYWLDSSQNSIGKEPFKGNSGSGSVPVTYIDQPIVSPPNAAYLVLNKNYDSNYEANVKAVGDVVKSQELKDAVIRMKPYISVETELAPVYVGNGKFYYDDGERTNEYFDYYKYPVLPNCHYTFSSGFATNTDIWFVYWLDGNNNIISKEPYTGNPGAGSADAIYVDTPVSAPANAAYLVLNVSNVLVVAHNVKVSPFMGMKGYLPSCNLNNVTETGTWLLIDSNTYQNVPESRSAGFLKVSVLGSWVLQEFYTFTTAALYKRQFDKRDSATEWSQVSGGGGSVTNEYTFNEYSQTVNLSASPTITTDTNNYLASTGDTTDRTSAVLAMLQATGICHLGPGVFYVSNLVMPDGTSIIGSGVNTEIRLPASVTSGFAIRVGGRCSLSDFRMNGQDQTASAIGNRSGILWQGTYTQSQTAPASSLIKGLIIQNFNGGGITCYDTGYGTYNFLNVSNVNIEKCGAGLNISYWSEYHKFTNVDCFNCYIGCINNGGNNMFVNCDFSSSRYIAFLMDNAQSQSPNNSHGSCVGCVFNHTAGNTGDGIQVLNCDVGFVFDGCQIFYSKIHIEDSDGVSVIASNFGIENCDIYVSGGGSVLFANNLHQGVPTITITNNNKVHFVNCYVRDTGEAIRPDGVTGVKGSSESSYRTGNVEITKANIGLSKVGNFKAVSTVANQGLSNIEKSNARTNIGAGTSNFSGDYDDLSNKPTIPCADKSYAPLEHSGLGRKNLELKGNGSNILTQEDFSDANTIYVIRYDFDLNNTTITMPANCVLEFDGGSVTNGLLGSRHTIVTGNYTTSSLYGVYYTVDGKPILFNKKPYEAEKVYMEVKFTNPSESEVYNNGSTYGLQQSLCCSDTYFFGFVCQEDESKWYCVLYDTNFNYKGKSFISNNFNHCNGSVYYNGYVYIAAAIDGTVEGRVGVVRINAATLASNCINGVDTTSELVKTFDMNLWGIGYDPLSNQFCLGHADIGYYITDTSFNIVKTISAYGQAIRAKMPVINKQLTFQSFVFKNGVIYDLFVHEDYHSDSVMFSAYSVSNDELVLVDSVPSISGYMEIQGGCFFSGKEDTIFASFDNWGEDENTYLGIVAINFERVHSELSMYEVKNPVVMNNIMQIYIDNTYTGAISNGTEGHPFKSFGEIKGVCDSAYHIDIFIKGSATKYYAGVIYFANKNIQINRTGSDRVTILGNIRGTGTTMTISSGVDFESSGEFIYVLNCHITFTNDSSRSIKAPSFCRLFLGSSLHVDGATLDGISQEGFAVYTYNSGCSAIFRQVQFKNFANLISNVQYGTVTIKLADNSFTNITNYKEVQMYNYSETFGETRILCSDDCISNVMDICKNLYEKADNTVTGGCNDFLFKFIFTFKNTYNSKDILGEYYNYRGGLISAGGEVIANTALQS